MAIEININTAATTGNVSVSQDNAPATQGKKDAPILNGKSLTVTNGAMSDIEKLVARLKAETDDTKMSVTQQRISVLQTVLNTMSDRITEKEKATLIEIEALNGEKSEAEVELSSLMADKVATEGRIAELDVMIEALEKQIDQAVQDGEDHRKQVEKLKKQRAEDQGRLDQINTAISSANSKISGIDVKIAKLTQTIAQTTLNEVANALRIAASDKPSPSSTTESSDMSNAERVKEEKREAETNIGNVIRESLDKIDDQMRDTLDEAQMKVKG